MDRLKQYLEDEELTQTEFAALVGVKQPTVWDWISGRCLPMPKRLRMLSRITGISIDELLA
jgi:transcriptional regulator with XRE-family HTH domain